MAARQPFWKWHRWKSIGFCLWRPSICIWNLKLKFQSKLDLCSGNHVVYRQTDGQTDRRTDGRTRWIQYTPPPTSLGGGIKIVSLVQFMLGRCHRRWGAAKLINYERINQCVVTPTPGVDMPAWCLCGLYINIIVCQYFWHIRKR